ncbi:MAG: ABC transporter ATP-binding protein [Acidimicrobiia bacterium]|nr:ABC transporter ATP-binding protein [Acidimicrobiia bacterium]
MIDTVEMRGIVKRFPGVLANDHVDFDVRSGEIHGLLGENGAGKSTLMNLLYGLDRPDEGEIVLDGRPLTLTSPQDAIRAGIGMVHQHFMLVSPMTVAQNVALGLPSSRGLRTDLDVVTARVNELAKTYGLDVDPARFVSDLSVGEQQRVEIIKALYREASLLILDEPTAVLTPQEVDEFFGFLNEMRLDGHSIIFISHKLAEVIALTDRVTVLRDGRNAGTVDTRDTDKADLARRMVGREFSLTRSLPRVDAGPPLLEIEDAHAVTARGTPALRGVSLTVNGGEIVGLAGVSGNGQVQLAQAIAGLHSLTSGHIRISGAATEGRSVRKLMDQGLGYVPEERNRDGMIKEFSIAENLILRDPANPEFVRRGLFRFGRIDEHGAHLIERFAVKTPSASVPISSLSGGNAQKVILARELDRDPSVLVVAQPTRGLDIGASEFIRDQIVAARSRGTAVLLLSEDLEELLALSDRVATIFDGRLMGIVDREEADPSLLGLMMAGETLEQARAHTTATGSAGVES